jgi:hypothetical protein
MVGYGVGRAIFAPTRGTFVIGPAMCSLVPMLCSSKVISVYTAFADVIYVRFPAQLSQRMIILRVQINETITLEDKGVACMHEKAFRGTERDRG